MHHLVMSMKLHEQFLDPPQLVPWECAEYLVLRPLAIHLDVNLVAVGERQYLRQRDGQHRVGVVAGVFLINTSDTIVDEFLTHDSSGAARVSF